MNDIYIYCDCGDKRNSILEHVFDKKKLKIKICEEREVEKEMISDSFVKSG